MNRIKQLREELNYSQNDLAEKLGGAPSSIAMYEKGDRKPSLEVLVKLSKIFNCSIDYWLGKSNIRNPEELTLDPDKIKIGLSTRDYGIPTKEQQDKIEEFAKFVLQENLKKKNNNN